MLFVMQALCKENDDRKIFKRRVEWLSFPKLA